MFGKDPDDLAARVQRLEAQVNYLLARLNVNPDEFDAPLPITGEITPGQLDELKSLLRRGQKINAIKQYRLYTGLGLKESKNAMDALEKQL
ncbi:MAG TPA: hypothetical protein VH540_28050 [Ktedonobacterales bacterium]|jgi:hypothetical protein